jgi:hypothetical protein
MAHYANGTVPGREGLAANAAPLRAMQTQGSEWLNQLARSTYSYIRCECFWT